MHPEWTHSLLSEWTETMFLEIFISLFTCPSSLYTAADVQLVLLSVSDYYMVATKIAIL